jgi:hypothetical protein
LAFVFFRSLFLFFVERHREGGGGGGGLQLTWLAGQVSGTPCDAHNDAQRASLCYSPDGGDVQYNRNMPRLYDSAGEAPML